MAPRFTEAEKGKQQFTNEKTDKIKRIKAPRLDNEALIRDNALTLIGRLTEPPGTEDLGPHTITAAKMEPARSCSWI